MSISPENKGICLIIIGAITIIASIQKEWGVVGANITGIFALLNLSGNE
jgi:hypothetical protein